MRRTTCCFILAIAMAGVGNRLVAQSPPPASSPERPNGANAPTAIDGKWTMTVEVESADRVSTLEIKLDGNKISGAIRPPSGEYPFAGELTDGKLRFTAPYRDLTLKFEGALKDNGTLAGTVDYGDGSATWTAERVKDK